MKVKSSKWRSVFDIEDKKKKAEELKKKVADENLWEDQERAVKIQKELSQISDDIEAVEGFKKGLCEIKEIKGETRGDSELLLGIENELNALERKIKKEEYKVFLSGKHDKKDALLEISSGAGGRDAEDFVAMLVRMYQRYSERKGFKAEIISVSYGEAGGPEGRTGIKNVLVKVMGDYAYGFLKEESGSHRLVRKSPFSSGGARHTSFAQVEIFPIIDNNGTQVDVKNEDLRIDTFRASGPGGQYVNKRESAIRITHIPTGIVVSSQSERLQGENKSNALNILKAKLQRIEEDKKREEMEERKKGSDQKSWGSQIRNYIIHPYQLAKDLRTNKETSSVEDVLDGNIDLLKDDFFQ